MCHKQLTTHSSGFLGVLSAKSMECAGIRGWAGLHLELFLGTLSCVNLFISMQNEKSQT